MIFCLDVVHSRVVKLHMAHKKKKLHGIHALRSMLFIQGHQGNQLLNMLQV